MIIQEKTLGEIRRSIGRKLQDVIVSSATATAEDGTELEDTYGLAKGADDEYNGRQVMIFNPTGSIEAGEKSFVIAFESTAKIATVSPAFSAAVTEEDEYEMWHTYLVEDVDDAINDAIMEVTDDCLQIKEIHNVFTCARQYEYDCLSGFSGLYRVEYVTSEGTKHRLHNCDTVWDELVDGDVTASVDTAIQKEGTGCLKLVVADGCGAGDILATENITATDISDCDEVEIWIYSTVALNAGDIQLLLDNNAKCASPVETLDIPATLANTWTRHCLKLANPQNDSAIISVGLKMVVEKGAFTLYADDIEAVKFTSKIWKELNPDFWSISKGTTKYLNLEHLSIMGTPTQLRLTGYRIPVLLEDDSAVSEIDPSWLISRVTGRLLIAHAKSSQLDIKDRAGLSGYWLGEAEKRMTTIRTSIAPNTRWTA